MSRNNLSIESLLQDVYKVFSSTSNFSTANIVTCPCEECKSVERAFKNKTWATLDDETIESNYDNLSLLSPQAFYYFLPAFLSYSLRNFYPESLVCQFTIYALTPEKLNATRKIWWKQKFSLFSSEQIEIIFKFLDLVKQDDRFYDYYTIIERGKKRLQELLKNEN